MLICEESAQEYDDIRNMEYYTAMKKFPTLQLPKKMIMVEH